MVLLITRLKDIARFTSLTPHPSKILLYTLFQIPYILPIAIPISCMISAFLLFQRLSQTEELTSLRSCSFSIKKIITPIIVISILISFINFYISSEITPYCRIGSKKLAASEMTVNPIALLEKKNLLNIKNAYIDMDVAEDRTLAKDLIFIIKNRSTNRLNLLSAKKISVKDKKFIGERISIISHLDDQNEKGFDTLIIENQKNMEADSKTISKYMKPTTFSINPLHLPTKLLLAREKFKRTIKEGEKYIFSIVEIMRRVALSLSAFSLTFIGICFGIEIGRNRSRKKLILASIFALLILLSFMIGKAFKYQVIASSLFYLLPQPIIIALSSVRLKKISGGIE